MLAFLFRRLTASSSSGIALFDALTAEARQPHWYVEGKIPDTFDGRFAVLATITAMALVRLEDDGNDGIEFSVKLTERFIEVMESEHRELGLGDPTLGKTVRKLVGMLGRRTEMWRSAFAGECDWAEAVRQSLYREGAGLTEMNHCAAELARLRHRLQRTRLSRLEQGSIA